MTGLPQMWPVQKTDTLPDHIEQGVRIAGMKMKDAAVWQNVAAANSRSVRQMMALEPMQVTSHGNIWQGKTQYNPATERFAREAYAYARYLRGIDDYWLSTEQTIPERIDYKIEAVLAAAGPAVPAP